MLLNIHDYFIRRRMHLKYINKILEKIEAYIPNSIYKNKFKHFIKSFEVWSTTYNIKVASNIGKNTDYKVFEIENFLSDDICDHIIKLAKKKGMIDSTIVNDEGKRVIDIATRKSQQCWLEDNEDDKISYLSKIIAELSSIPIEHQEHLQVVSYEPECYYKPHFDASYHPNVIPVMNHGCGPRIYTFIVYLNECEGGETEFPKLGIKIKPKKGKAILFQNVDNNLDLIPESMHAGCQVTSGVKWIANKWIRAWPFEIATIIKMFEQQQPLSKLSYLNKILYLIPKSIISYSNIKSILYHNILCRNFPLAFYDKDNYQIYEIDDYLSSNTCDTILNNESDNNLLDCHITNDLNSFITVPTQEPYKHHNELNIICKEPHEKEITISPYTNIYKKKGLPICSIYIFLNDDYTGGFFTFPNIKKRIIPKKGRALIFLSVDNALAYDPRSLCIIHSNYNKPQYILEKHIQILPNDLTFVLEKPKEWSEQAYLILKDNNNSYN